MCLLKMCYHSVFIYNEETTKAVSVFFYMCMIPCPHISACLFCASEFWSRTDIFFSCSIQISSAWPGSSFRASVGKSVQRGSSILQGDSVNPVLQNASSVQQRIAASTAAQDTGSETASASPWSAVQVRDAGIST